jgi:alpha-galactosidase
VRLLTAAVRPVLLNSWEGVTFDYNNASTLVNLAQETADLGISLFVNDDTAGLGDWIPNPDRFPDGFGNYVSNVTNIDVANSTQKLKFGLWFEPGMLCTYIIIG